jgi:hypothetical protein
MLILSERVVQHPLPGTLAFAEKASPSRKEYPPKMGAAKLLLTD